MRGYIDDAVTGFRDRFNAAVAQFDERVAALDQTESDLWATQDVVYASGDAQLQADFQAAADKISAMQASVASVRSTIQTVVGWWSSVKSSLGIAGESGGTLAGLALLPAIPWGAMALIVGGTAAIAGVIYAASLVITRARQYQHQAAVDAAVAAGEPIPPDAYPVAEPGIFDAFTGFGNSAIWIIGGLVVLAVLPGLMRGNSK